MRKVAGYYFAAILVFAALVFSGCEPTFTETCGEKIVAIESQFTIKNESSSERNIRLYDVHFHSDGWYYAAPCLVSSKVIDSKSEAVIQLPQSINEGSGGIMSFMLTVDYKNYAGWKLADAEKQPKLALPAEEYELGYLDISQPFPAHLQSKLTPRQYTDGIYPNKAFYTVTITDDAVEFVLEKKINQTGNVSDVDLE
jgi:hypothetical protein